MSELHVAHKVPASYSCAAHGISDLHAECTKYDLHAECTKFNLHACRMHEV